MDILSHTQLELPRYICEGHKRCNQRYNQSHNYAHKQRQNEKYRVLHMEQAAVIHTNTVTQMLGSQNTITGTIRHNHKHETHTHDSSQSPAAAHTDTHRQPQSQKHRVTLLATSPSQASPPSPQVPHTKPPSPARRTLQTDRAVPGPWGAAPWPSLNPGAWGARTEEGGGGLSAVWTPPRQLGSPRDKEGGLGDLCPGTLDQAFLCVCGGVA